MKFIKDNVLYSLQEIYDLFPNVSFPVGFDVKEFGFSPLLDTLPPENTETQYAVEDGWKEENGKFIVKWKRVDYTQEELAEINSQKEKNRKQNILYQIYELESTITPRILREHLLGSVVVNPKTGRTATEQIAWVNSSIDSLRATL